MGGERPQKNAFPYMGVLLEAGTASVVKGGATLSMNKTFNK